MVFQIMTRHFCSASSVYDEELTTSLLRVLIVYTLCVEMFGAFVP